MTKITINDKEYEVVCNMNTFCLIQAKFGVDYLTRIPELRDFLDHPQETCAIINIMLGEEGLAEGLTSTKELVRIWGTCYFEIFRFLEPDKFAQREKEANQQEGESPNH